MKFRTVLIAVLCAVVALTAVELAPAGADPKQGPTIEKRVKRGPRGPRGRRGPRGAQGPAGIARIVTVEGASVTFPPGGYGAVPTAQCPAGAVVVGTGFNGPFDVVGGFVLAFGTFVGGFFENESSIPLDANVQAICAVTDSASASASAAGQWGRYQQALEHAEQLASASH